MENLDVSLTLDILIPRAIYYGSLTNNNQEDYDSITWDDIRDKPSWELINTCMTTCPDIDFYDWDGSAWVLNQTKSDEINSCSIRKLRDLKAICALDAKSKYEREQNSIAKGISVSSSMTDAEYISVLQYLQDLFELPEQDGFPWEGPEDPACPWPSKPPCVCDCPLIK